MFDPFLNDLNLLTRVLLLLVIFGRVFSIVIEINFDTYHSLVTYKIWSFFF